MRRRSFITFLGGAAVWPLAARAQQRAWPVIGWLGPAVEASRVAAFREGLKEIGFVEGENTSIEFQSGDYEHVQALARDLAEIGGILPDGEPRTGGFPCRDDLRIGARLARDPFDEVQHQRISFAHCGIPSAELFATISQPP